MGKIFSIAKVTFKEMIRQPVYSVILYVGVIMIFVSPWFSMFTLLHSDKLVRDMGLATILLACALIASFSASGLVYKEIDNKTALTILSKPVFRVEFILGKFMGIVCGIFFAVLQLTITLTLTMRLGVPEIASSVIDSTVVYGIVFCFVFSFVWAGIMNYFFDKPFTSSLVMSFCVLVAGCFLSLMFIGPGWKIGELCAGIDFRLFEAGILLFFASSVLVSVAVLGSIRLNVLPNLCLCVCFFFVAMTSDYFFGRFAQENVAFRFLYSIIPNLQFFWVSDVFIENSSIPFNYIAMSSLYGLGCVLFTLFLSWVSFGSKEIS